MSDVRRVDVERAGRELRRDARSELKLIPQAVVALAVVAAVIVLRELLLR